MKISANFSTTRPRLTLPLVVLLWTASFVCVGLTVWFAIGIFDTRADLPQLESRLARLNEQLAAIKPREVLPPAAELESLRQRVSILNKLSSTRGMSTSQLFGWLEDRLPENVYLVSLHHKPREGEALLVAESSSAEALTGFLLRLEKELRTAEVLLSKQGTRSAPGLPAIQFEIRVRWKS